MKSKRLLAPLKSPGKARRRFLILLAVICVLLLTWASLREFQTIVSEGGGLSAKQPDVDTGARSSEGVVGREEDMEGDDEGDYYGGEMDVKGEEAGVVGGREVDVDPPPKGNHKERAVEKSEAKDIKDTNDTNDTKEVKEEKRKDAGNARNESVDTTKPSLTFTVMEHADFFGDKALEWGPDNILKTADECSHACSVHEPRSSNDPPCNLWVFCGDKMLCGESFQQCWLKYVAHPDAAQPSSEGPSVGWTSGIARSSAEKPVIGDDSASSDRSFHVIISAQGEATHWQSRIHYYWYLKIRKQCQEVAEVEGTRCDMGGFTRLLHDDQPDDLVDEIPTFVAKTLPKEHPHHGYIVLNRPYAFLQWVQQVTIKEKYVLMGEPDHIWLKPLANPMVGDQPAAFPFFYIEPTKDEYLPITERFVGPLDTFAKKTQMYPIGSSPTIMSMEDMKRVVPLWYNLSLKVHEDDDAVEKWGWVQEMYAFSMAMYQAGLPVTLLPDLMAQPPWDWDARRYTLLHYTYGMDYTLEGVFTPGKVGQWHWDKRDFRKPIPQNMEGPPEGTQNELVKELISRLNEATRAIPMWDVYARTWKVEPWKMGRKTIDGTQILEK